MVGLVITALNPGYLNEIFTDPRGNNLMLAFVVLLACGLLTMRWIINGVRKTDVRHNNPRAGCRRRRSAAGADGIGLVDG